MRFALGFLLTVVLWGICYFVLMGPGLLVGDLLFSMMCFCILPGGMIAGRWRAGSGATRSPRRPPRVVLTPDSRLPTIARLSWVLQKVWRGRTRR